MRGLSCCYIRSAYHRLSCGPPLPEQSWSVRHDGQLPSNIKRDQSCGALKLVLDFRSPCSPNYRPRAEPEKDGKAILMAEVRERRLQSQ